MQMNTWARTLVSFQWWMGRRSRSMLLMTGDINAGVTMLDPKTPVRTSAIAGVAASHRRRSPLGGQRAAGRLTWSARRSPLGGQRAAGRLTWSASLVPVLHPAFLTTTTRVQGLA